MDSNDPILVSKVREGIEKEYKSNTDLYYECDLDRLRDNDWYIRRFLLASKLDVEKACVMARDALQWRKSYGLNERTDMDFPIEFYKTSFLFPYSVDREERTVIYMRVKMYRHFPKFIEYFKQFLIHIINKTDVQSVETGFAMVWDMAGTGPSNWDLSMIRFIISSMRNYFPKGLQYLVVYGCPWIMNAFVSIAIKILPEESRNKIKFASKEEIFNFIAQANLPDFMGGKCDRDYRESPKGAKGLRELLGHKNDYSEQDIDSVLNHFDRYINE